ncbi:MAG: selenocysteine-specific translation elongation factor [Planctomycetes bacterium]|nr:selenocysteine-specific translation elongation factor [Planctomycetota bacterium]
MANEIFNIIIGTAGHIDHGKSALVRRLTGIDPDRLPEEKERGMTIDLGFAPMTLDDGRKTGIIDVPGHEKFIKNMVAGATAVDFVLFVIAADDRVMPQSEEHLHILALLGIQNGIVVINKTDLVSAEALEAVKRDIAAFVKGTFLEKAPIACVSAATGDGIEGLARLINEKVKAIPARKTTGIFRMPVQRVFSSKGFGTVITGVPLSGTVRIGDTVEILPLMSKARVKNLQAYKEKVDIVRAGHSSAINISDIDHFSISRGFTAVAPGYMKPVTILHAVFRCLKFNGKPVKNHTSVRVHTGTSETLGKLALLDTNNLKQGEESFVQLKFNEPMTAAWGDSFIARLQSPMITIGGGVILRAQDTPLKLGKSGLIDALKERLSALGDDSRMIRCVLREKGFYPPPEDAIAKELLKTKFELKPALDKMTAENLVTHLGQNKILDANVKDLANKVLMRLLEKAENDDPLNPGMRREKIQANLKMDAVLLELLLTEQSGKNNISISEEGAIRKIRPAEASPATERLSQRQTELFKKISEILLRGRFMPPGYDEIIRSNFKDAREGAKMINFIIQNGELIRLSEGIIMHKTAVHEAEEIAMRLLDAKGGLAPRDFCDALKTSRKYAIPLLEYFDKIGLTIRNENTRVLKKR